MSNGRPCVRSSVHGLGVFLSALAALQAAPARAADFWVDGHTAVAGDGSATRPMRTIQAVAAKCLVDRATWTLTLEILPADGGTTLPGPFAVLGPGRRVFVLPRPPVFGGSLPPAAAVR